MIKELDIQALSRIYLCLFNKSWVSNTNRGQRQLDLIELIEAGLEVLPYAVGVVIMEFFVSFILCVVILLQRARMSDDSETVEDTEKGSLAEVTDDSCTVEFIEIAPLDRASDDYHKLEFIDPVVEVKPEDLQEIKHEPADEYNSGDHNYCVIHKSSDASDCRNAIDSFTSEFIEPVVEVKPEGLLDVKQEPADEIDNEDSNYSMKPEPTDEYKTEAPCFTVPVQVSSAFMWLTDLRHSTPASDIFCYVIRFIFLLLFSF